MMEVLTWMQNAALFACPLVAYILLFKGRHKHKNQQSHYSIPYWNFFLKKWWVRWTVWRLHPYTRHAVVPSVTAFMPRQQDEVIETPRMLIGEKEIDSMMISGTDHKGTAVHLRITRKRHSEIQIWLYVQLENGSVFLLPEHPDSTLISINKNSWVGGGLKFQVCEPLRKWRISFNGLLSWTACSDVIDVQKDWNTALKCDAIAREPWRSAAWMKMRKQMGEGYDQWGTLHGTWRSVDYDAEPRELYLRGIRRRRYGTDEAVYLRRSVSYGGVATDGTMFSIEARSCEKPGLTHAVFGHVYRPNGCHALVSSCDLLLSNHGEYPESIPKHAILRFTAGSRNYTCTVHTTIDTATAVHGGRPWHYEAHIIPFRCNLNMKQGAGTAVFWYRYSGIPPVLLSLSRPLLREPQLKYEGPVALVVDFRDRQCASSSLVGGKGASLGLMTSVKTQKLGAEIPAGFCLTVEALHVQMQEFHQLQQAITTLQLVSSISTELSDIQEQCSRTVTLFESTPVCETVSFEVLRHLQHLLKAKSEPQLFAVRSSAVGEDSKDLSAAGQNATLLGVHGELSDVLEAIQKCWASLYTFQSLQYRRQHGQRVQVDMGVVIQQMVAADKAGVLFTWHPTTGDPRQMLITANFGLGESVVSAQVEPDTILLTRDRAGHVAVTETKCGRKSHKVAVSAAGVMAELLESDKVYQLCLTTPEALALGKLGVHLEQMFGDPRDIEWAISEDKIYLLQARPITSLNSWSDFELLHEFDSPVITDTEVLTTANVGEVFPGAVTPLSQSITFRSADLATRQGLPYRPGYHYTSNIVTTSYHGMINVLNTMLRSIGKEIQLADKVIDLAIYGHPVTSMKFFRLAIERNGALNSLGKISLVLKILTDIILKGRVIRRAKKLSSEFVLDYEGQNSAKSLYNYISNNLHILAKVAECHGYTSRVGLFTQAVAITVLTEGNEDLTEDHYHDMGLLLSSCSDVVSAEIPAALEDLATSIAATGKAVAFCKVRPSQAVTWLSKNCPIVAIKLNGFLNKHGHRCIKEFELMIETWGMKPEGLMKTVQTMLMSSTGGEHHNYAKNNISDETLLASLKSVKKPSTRKALGWLLSMCRSTVAGREANKDCYINVTHKLRQAYRHLAGLMVKEGRIPDPQLLFFFSHYELGLLLSTRDPILIIKAQRRRRLYSQWERLTYPEINIGIPVPLPLVSHMESKNSRSCLRGTAVCPGTVLGRACVITDVEQISKLKQNDILITHSTDVGWSPYFPLLAGIVTELGGLISHGAVVAREYGLPCIVGCQDATRMFATGDTVLLVGAMGTLEKIDSSAETSELLTDTVC